MSLTDRLVNGDGLGPGRGRILQEEMIREHGEEEQERESPFSNISFIFYDVNI